jgi:putative pyruvate formate lyase activating enzyme
VRTETRSQKEEASYLRLLRTGELERRVLKLEALLESCTVCPRDCLNNRLKDEIAACYFGRLPVVSSYTAHYGEEPALVGTGGAGNIFFGYYYLRKQFVLSGEWRITEGH